MSKSRILFSHINPLFFQTCYTICWLIFFQLHNITGVIKYKSTPLIKHSSKYQHLNQQQNYIKASIVFANNITTNFSKPIRCANRRKFDLLTRTKTSSMESEGNVKPNFFISSIKFLGLRLDHLRLAEMPL